MKLKYFLGIFVTLMIMGALFYKDRPTNPMQTIEETDESANSENLKANSKIDQNLEKQVMDDKSAKEKNAALSTEQNLEVQKAFSDHLKKMAACLGYAATLQSEKMDPTFDNLSAHLKETLGEMVVKMDDWTQQDFKAEDGSLRRIRTEIEYQDTGTPVKRAQFYKINTQGMPEMQNINAEQAVNPSDDFLNSLRGEGQITLEEKGGRAYYQDGEELVMVERGGKIQSFSLTKGEKTYSCTETDATTSNCQCL